MLARGGDCAVHRDCLTLELDQTDVLLLGTRAQYQELTEKLREQAFGLPQAGEQIAELLERIDVKPASLQVGNYTLPLGERTLVMGILNVTPEFVLGRRAWGRFRGGGHAGAAYARRRGRHASISAARARAPDQTPCPSRKNCTASYL